MSLYRTGVSIIYSSKNVLSTCCARRDGKPFFEYESISMIVRVSGEYLTLNYSYDDDHFEAAPRFLLLRATFDTI